MRGGFYIVTSYNTEREYDGFRWYWKKVMEKEGRDTKLLEVSDASCCFFILVSLRYFE